MASSGDPIIHIDFDGDVAMVDPSTKPARDQIVSLDITTITTGAAARDDDNGNSDTDKDEDEEDDEDDWRKRFQNAMTALNQEALKDHAIEVRRNHIFSTGLEPSTLSCSILEEPLHGSYNVVYVIVFSDGVKWVARIPIQGNRVKEADVDKLRTDYSTLKYIRRTLDIPVPEIYTFETTCDRIGVPFALMAFVDGVSVSDRWFDKEWVTEEKRLKILTNLVHIMAKLQKPRFSKIGTLRFTDEKTISHIGPMHTVVEDEEEYLEEGTIHVEQYGPFGSPDEWLKDGWDTFEDNPKFVQRVPAALRLKGVLEVLNLARQSIPPYLRRSDRYQIDVWDFNYQNILIDDDCNVTALLDWDGVRTVPQGMGCTRYPSWITRDWDPAEYEIPEDGNWEREDSPETLQRYRKHYADTFASLNLPDYDPRETRLSHILEAIRIGTCNRPNRGYIMTTLLDHAYGSKTWPMDYQEIADALISPSSPGFKSMRRKILNVFKTMWHAEWEKPVPAPNKRNSQGFRKLLPRVFGSKAGGDGGNVPKDNKRKRTSGDLGQFLSSKRARIMSILKR
jgi:hypothetical protein